MFLGGLFCALVSTISEDTTDKRKCVGVKHRQQYSLNGDSKHSSFPPFIEDTTDKRDEVYRQKTFLYIMYFLLIKIVLIKTQ